MADNNGKNGTPDIVHAKLPIHQIATIFVFVIGQIILFTVSWTNMDNRIGILEFDNQRLSLKIVEQSEQADEDNHGSRLQALEMKMGTLYEKVYNGRSRSHDSVLKIQGKLANHDYRLSNIEASVKVQVNPTNDYSMEED